MAERTTLPGALEHDVWSHIAKGGIAAGIAGGIALAVVLEIVAALHGTSFWLPLKGAAYPLIGERAMEPGFAAGPVLLGVITHFAISIVWGFLFAALFFGFSPGATVGLGVLWGVVVWFAMYHGVLPSVGLGDVARATPVSAALVPHVIFGLAVSVGFLPYQRPHAQGPHWWWRERFEGAH